MKKIFLFSLFFANTAFAASDSTTFSGNISLQGNYQSGNFNTITLGGKLNSSLSKKKNNLDLVASYRNTQIKINDTSSFSKREDEKYSLIAYSKVIGKYKLIALNENEISFLRKIEMRNSFGVGMGYKFVKTDKTELEISEVILSENSRYKEDSLNINTFRSSTRFKFLYNSYPFNLSCIWFLQPPLWSSNKEVRYKDNLNVRANTTFDVNLTKKFLIGISDELIVQTYAYIMVGKKISPYDNSITVYLKFNL
jgi:hypothetical protein